ncbi:RNA polymerase sigma-70 factor (family 1) [Parabacteroides sp. PF5-5]|uniref:RNA polymerase sigma-70 factor n=1 Tax=unclassified Parabacteroides TaxID=2649774 RepID=UPI00247565FA|nr:MULTISPECIES: RNA polymerase sigma-70 factor [unclassified Parabacteroides]MDH6303942.1 RNA polymerase sigma-70 factor (family 1) [Parabacteroides sp. PH5-39]MDH6314559.1 RNA polymerase sigma-70 factor (family 1) [Parabacteroides sp. PF5-13]MDH6318376.1 RNA polymerase sigma-70 factor (family 1) [Parabacteroides sp. PH5-13]MDH6322331.1 RNA polymerase sigma-70 factor (family 1) [Parabacteroides sp. PH5-8]MDH6325589.1 RNA polymerase sigma-70 factor (family 1) [Parabacteroides sp. PH5-41]
MLVVDENIIKRINRGDAKAFEQLYSLFYVYLCAIATKFIYDAEAAKEIVNDVFLSVWNNRQSLAPPVNSYLIKSVQNRCLNHLRQKRLQQVPLTEVQEHLFVMQEQLIAQDAHPLKQLENKEFEQQLLAAVNKLPKKCRDIFIQHLYHNKTYDEIAQINQIASSTVRVQIKIGIAKLKEQLSHIIL